MMMGRLLTSWDLYDRTLAIGFSLGAQEVNGGQQIAQCHCLDPAGLSIRRVALNS